MVVIEWSDEVRALVDYIYTPMCVGSYKNKYGSIYPWSVIDPDVKMNFFTWSIKYNDWIFSGDQYNKKIKNWWNPLHSGQLCFRIINENKITEKTLSEFSGSVKFNGIPIEVNPEIPIKFYKDGFFEHITINRMWDVFSLLYPCNQ